MLLYAESYFYGKLWLPEELIHPSGCTVMSKKWWAGTEIRARAEAVEHKFSADCAVLSK